jgi:hypothetical protein
VKLRLELSRRKSLCCLVQEIGLDLQVVDSRFHLFPKKELHANLGHFAAVKRITATTGTVSGISYDLSGVCDLLARGLVGCAAGQHTR